MSWVDVLDFFRLAYILVGGLESVLLGWRAMRWLNQREQIPWLHLGAVFLCAAAAAVGITQLHKNISPIFPANFLGIFCVGLFLVKTPAERVFTWEEKRGDPPDWDSRFDNLGR